MQTHAQTSLSATHTQVIATTLLHVTMRRKVSCPDAETDVDVIPIAVDITMKEGRELVLAACPNPDILINNAHGPLPGDFRQVAREDWICTVDANMLTPIF